MRTEGLSLTADLFFGQHSEIRRRKGSSYLYSDLVGRVPRDRPVQVLYRKGLQARAQSLVRVLRKNGYRGARPQEQAT